MVIDCGPVTGDGIPGASVAANQFVVVEGLPTKVNVAGLKPIQSVIAVGALFTRRYWVDAGVVQPIVYEPPPLFAKELIVRFDKVFVLGVFRIPIKLLIVKTPKSEVPMPPEFMSFWRAILNSVLQVVLPVSR
jgi:hypothetical protein